MTKRATLAALALAGIFVAVYLYLYKVGAIGNLSCSIGSCETVNTSKWATQFGLPVAAWGVVFYVILFVLSIVAMGNRYAGSVTVSKVLVFVTAVGFAVSLYLTYLELFVIHAICQWCVVSAIIVTIAFIVALLDWREKSRPASADMD